MWKPYLQRPTNPMGSTPVPNPMSGLKHPVTVPYSPNIGEQQLNHLEHEGQPSIYSSPEQQTMHKLAHFNNLKRMLKRTI